MTKAEITALESELAGMDDRAVTRFYNTLDVEDPRCDIVAGEMERRDIDL